MGDREICQKCGGFCCNNRFRGVHLYQKESKKHLGYLGAKSKFYVDDGDCRWFCLYEPCPHFKDNGCDIYKNRPDICREFPMDNLKPIWQRSCALFRKNKGGK